MHMQVDKPQYTTEKEHELVLLPDYVTVALPCPDLPELVLQTINGIIVSWLNCLQQAQGRR